MPCKPTFGWQRWFIMYPTSSRLSSLSSLSWVWCASYLCTCWRSERSEQRTDATMHRLMLLRHQLSLSSYRVIMKRWISCAPSLRSSNKTIRTYISTSSMMVVKTIPSNVCVRLSIPMIRLLYSLRRMVVRLRHWTMVSLLVAQSMWFVLMPILSWSRMP